MDKINIPLQQLVDLYIREGLGIDTIAHQLHCSRSCVYTRLLEYGLDIRPRTPKKSFPYSVLLELYSKQLLPIRDIAKQLHTTRGTVRKCLDDYQIPPRPRVHRGSSHYNWRGGKIPDGKGYMQIYVSSEDSLFIMAQNNHILEHRLIMAQHLGRPLKSWEIVHHLNGIKTDNRIANLGLVNRNNHAKQTLNKLLQAHIRDLEAKLAQQKLL